MKCPRDGTELQPVRLPGLVLDKCHLCDGLWLDDGELKKLMKLNIADIEELLEQKYGDPSFVAGSPQGFMRCPRCAGRLQGITITYARPVRVDRCEQCLGLWLDDTELDAVLGDKKKLDDTSKVGHLARFVQNLWKGET